MSLDGLRAWIGEVERKLGMRTRVFLVLSVIAIGGAGAAIYLAIDAQDSAVSESDVQALQRQLEARIDAGGTGGATGAGLAQLEAEVKALRSQVAQQSGKGGSQGSKGEGEGASTGGENGPAGGESPDASGSPTEGASGSAGSAAKLQELLEQAKKQSEQNE